MQNQKPPPGWVISQPLLEQLTPLTRAAVGFCHLSFLAAPSGNALLINCSNKEAVRLLQSPQLVEIAWVLQQTFGKTLICLYHAQEGLLMRWDGEQLSQGFSG
jgi:hypothetical protein